MKFLVTGGSGFIGSWLTRHLIERGHSVTLYLRRPLPDSNLLIDSTSSLAENRTPPPNFNFQFHTHLGELFDLESLAKACQHQDGVFHLAGYVGYKKSEWSLMHKINVEGTRTVLEACRKSGVPRLVHMSSVNAIGASFEKCILDENWMYNLSEFKLGYSESKLKAEELALSYNKKFEVVVVNPSSVYGPGDARKGSRSTQVKVARGRMPFYTGGGVSVADIYEVTKATLKAYEVGRAGQKYILAGENVTIKSLFELIAEAAGVAAPKIGLPNFVVTSLGQLGAVLEILGLRGPFNSQSAILSTMYHWFDSSKAKNELLYKVKPAKESIEASVQWMKSQGILSHHD